MSRAIVNPENESADEDTGKFSDSVDEKVPEMLRIVILCFLVMTVVAVILITPGPPQRVIDAQQGSPNLDETVIDNVIETQSATERANETNGQSPKKSLSNSPDKSVNLSVSEQLTQSSNR